MPPDLTLAAITGFRLVAWAPERLAGFYRALGFSLGEASAIGAEELAALGLRGRGLRLPMTLGPSRVDLDAFDPPGRPYPAATRACDPGFQHLALVTRDIAAAWRLALAAGAQAISRAGPVRLPPSSGGVTAVKFRDPDGHPLELLQFPDGAGAAWPGHGILGIDHSAIAVADLQASLAFYAGHGLRQGRRSLNQGPAQAALDGLDDPRVDVMPMEPAHPPPHVELLAYRHPAPITGPARRPNDVAATRIVWRGEAEALLRDPDGHLHQITREDRSPADTASR